jgi:hypothetical protein
LLAQELTAALDEYQAGEDAADSASRCHAAEEVFDALYGWTGELLKSYARTHAVDVG